MKKLTVCVSSEYDILIGRGLLKNCGLLLKEKIRPGKVAVVSDDQVDSHYGDLVATALAEAGFEVYRFVFQHGEAAKNLDNLGKILEFLAMQEFTRSDCLVALGGGVTGDLAGFAAAIFSRGIPYVQIPTTFLAGIDSSVGGKTAIDLTAGKNLAGAFHQPSLVIFDVDTLDTLPIEHFRDGVAEALKYGMLGNPALFAKLATGQFMEELVEIIERCIAMKRDIVMKDEFDQGERQFLNLGHTLGHSIEALSDFQISHGSAVAIGMYLIAKVAYQRGISQQDLSQPIKSALVKNGLPYTCAFSPAEIAKGTLTDKKRRGGTIQFVFPREIGECVLESVPVGDILGLLQQAMREE